jgi:hypothetical protein
VDVIVRREPGSSALSALVELKWARPGDDILYEAIYDLFKLALAAQREDRLRTYLLTTAEGAGEHWHVGSLLRAHQVIFDWLDDTMTSDTRAQAKPATHTPQ